MPTSLVVLEYVKTLIWPVVLLTTLVVFRVEVSKLFARVSRVEAMGAKAEFDKAVADVGLGLAPETDSTPYADVQSIVATTYEDARDIAEAYEDGPVIVDLSMADNDIAKRLVDFIAGLARGSNPRGAIERTSAKVFLLHR